MESILYCVYGLLVLIGIYFMGLGIVYICVVMGIDFLCIKVEVYLLNGLLLFKFVGFVEIVVQEVWECVCSVLINCGFEFFGWCIMVNFVFVDIFKIGGRYDLVIVLGLLIVFGLLFQ